MAERFHFEEGLSTNGGPSAAKHKPQPNTAIVEVLDKAGRILAMDVFGVSEPAGRDGWNPFSNCTPTFVKVGLTGLAHQELECLLSDAPLELPQHLLDKSKIGGHRAKVWWSCEA